MEDFNKRLLMIAGLCFGVLFFILVYDMARYGLVGGVIYFFNSLVRYIVYIAFVGLIVFVAYMILVYEFKYDVVNETRKDYMEECRISYKRGNMDSLWLSGDKEHKSIKLGKIIGYTHHSTFKQVPMTFNKQLENRNQLRKSEKISDVDVDKNIHWLEEDVFLVRKGIKRFLVRCPSYLHTELHNDVTIYCVGLIKRSYYFYPNTIDFDFDIIDKTIYAEGLIRANLRFIGNLVPVLEKASGLSKQDKDEVKGQSIMEKYAEKKGQTSGQSQGGK